MPVPLQIAQQIEWKIKMLEELPDYELSSNDRYNLYIDFGASRLLKYHTMKFEEFKVLSLADHVLSWLTIITVQKVLPLWAKLKVKKGQKITDDLTKVPGEIVTLAEKFLRYKTDFDTAFGEFHETYYYGINDYREIIDFRSYCIFMAAYDCLDVVLQGFNVEYPFLEQEEKPYIADYFTRALLAYSIVSKKVFVHQRRFDISTLKENGIEISEEKRKLFYKWWLTEAVPQAWELAHTTYRPPS
jgi:hypothetical protein